MTADLHQLYGQRMLSASEIGALPVSNLIYSVVGTTPTLITKPAPAGADAIQALVIFCEKGSFRIRTGDCSSTGTNDMPTLEFPAASEMVEGKGGVYMAAPSQICVPSPSLITVKGYSATSTISYYWL
jgi:hypothetical protein